MICLVKPFFEGVSHENKNSRRQYSGALERICDATQANALTFVGLIVSPILGSRGAIEFLALLSDSLPRVGTFLDLRDRAIEMASRRFSSEIVWTGKRLSTRAKVRAHVFQQQFFESNSPFHKAC
jgi:hypothetical protein